MNSKVSVLLFNHFGSNPWNFLEKGVTLTRYCYRQNDESTESLGAKKGVREHIRTFFISGFRDRGGDAGSQSFSQPGSYNTAGRGAGGRCTSPKYLVDAEYKASDTETD
jgi:hypothetical protein